MGWKFNPFTGALDQTGSGGGGASYIDGEVATYNDLPLDGTAPLNSAWLVRSASGVWPVSRKQAGIYIRTATAGSSRDADFTYAGTMPDVFSDAVFTLYDDASTTRTGQFNLGSVTAGQNRVLTWPDGNGTIALTTTVVDNATGLWDSANSVTGATVSDYELSVTDGTNVSNLTFPVGASRNYTLPNAAGTLALTSDFAAPPAIGSTTRNTGAFTTLNATNGTITASAPVLDLAQTWNNSAVTFTAFRINATNTNSSALSLLADFQVGGTTQFSVRRDGVVACVNRINITSAVNGLELSQASNGASPVRYTVDSAGTGNGQIRPTGNVMEQIGTTTTSSQTFRLYNTTDAGLTNFERGFMRWSSNVLQIGTEKAGTGSARALEFQTDGTTRASVTTGGNFWVNNQLILGTTVLARITSPADGVVTLFDSGQATFNRIQFGGTTSSFPALKRSSTALQVRLADDSAFAPLSCGALTLNGNLDASTRDIVTDTTTGTKIGTGTTQKIGFFNATPVVQQAAVADATDAASTQARLNDLLARLRTLGLIAT